MDRYGYLNKDNRRDLLSLPVDFLYRVYHHGVSVAVREAVVTLQLQDISADIGLWLLQRFNNTKDSSLCYRLHRLADHYDKNPTGQWDEEGD